MYLLPQASICIIIKQQQQQQQQNSNIQVDKHDLTIVIV
jgi:hypothetical protein